MIPSQKRGLEKSWLVTFLLAGDVFAQIVVDFLWLTGARYVQNTDRGQKRTIVDPQICITGAHDPKICAHKRKIIRS